MYICGKVTNAGSVGNISVYIPLTADFDVQPIVTNFSTIRPGKKIAGYVLYAPCYLSLSAEV